MKYNKVDVLEMIQESNFIEGETSAIAFKDAIKAWEFLEGRRDITTKTILDAHKILMKRLNPKIAGVFRDYDVYIGGEVRRFIDEKILKDIVVGWIKTLRLRKGIGVSEEELSQHTLSAHIGFEKIHPFGDGNGRIGRLLYNWHRMCLRLPIHIIHTGKEQMEYYKLFK